MVAGILGRASRRAVEMVCDAPRSQSTKQTRPSPAVDHPNDEFLDYVAIRPRSK